MPHTTLDIDLEKDKIVHPELNGMIYKNMIDQILVRKYREYLKKLKTTCIADVGRELVQRVLEMCCYPFQTEMAAGGIGRNEALIRII